MGKLRTGKVSINMPKGNVRWKAAVRRRRIRHFIALPAKIQNELRLICGYIRERDPDARIKLTGSWVKGTWADEHTKQAFRSMRMKMKRRTGLSDLDLVIQSSAQFTNAELQALIATRINVWKLNFDRVKGMLLFDREYLKRRK